ncbi:MAG: hypothetical protein WBE68_09225, partial [Candidatus Nitrosopolaris sp.]
MLQNLTILAVKKPVIKLYRVTCCTCSFFNGVPPKNLSQDYSLHFSGLWTCLIKHLVVKIHTLL